ncbi:hypothetical protein [Allopontixanthobacter sediminis]|uniref:Rho termination factor N-terminal domain-containing protein n=1 Tax=Allopontixanthobacter sediminis TaxID=1689985 RepID=A0A845AYF8_9SPHN|nr:hypothetical protein [Allopontixanthobacter sediminis]MXP42978.1 hypothetical protein [Allopontixanthobacter sediminis]
MAKHALTNATDGPKSVNSLTGTVVIAAGASEEVDLSEAEFISAKATGWFADDGDTELADMKVADLKALAESEGIDLGDATKKDDIISAIELAREAE